MPPSVQDLHIDQYLTNLSVDFVQDEEVFVHNEAFPWCRYRSSRISL